MSRRLMLVSGGVTAALVCACASILGIDDGTPRPVGDDASVPDVSAADTSTPKPDAADAALPTTCDPTKAFPPTSAVAALNTPATADEHARLSADELEVFFDSNRLGTFGLLDLYTATRATTKDAWSVPSNLGIGVNSVKNDQEPTLKPDQLTLLFASTRGGNHDVWVTTRSTPTSPFGAPAPVAALNTGYLDFSPYVPAAAQVLLASNRGTDAGPASLYQADENEAGTYAAPALINGIGKAAFDDREGAMTPDGLLLYFASNRAGGKGGFDIWVATRAKVTDPFGAATAVPELSTLGDDFPDWISADGCRLYFSTNRMAASTDFDILLAEKQP